MFPDRIKRVEESIKAEVGSILQLEMKDPRVQWATVQNVVVSRDLRHARIYVSLLDDKAEHAEDVIEALNSASGFVKRLLAGRIRMKFLPELCFFLDTTPTVAQHIDELYAEARRQAEASAMAASDGDSGDAGAG